MAHKDPFYLSHARRLAQQSIGDTGSSPAVGCIAVYNNILIGTGRTGKGGRPHAEEACNLQSGCTVYTTLEPCAHKAKHDGLSCADRLINAGVNRVVVGSTDPDKRTNGNGIAALKKAGISITITSCCNDLYRGFQQRLNAGKPFVALKLATSLDGRIALQTGESQWITGEQARQHGHLLRAKYDAMLVGTNTALKDKPRLNCRLPGLAGQNQAVFVMDYQQRIPDDFFRENPTHIRLDHTKINNRSVNTILEYIAGQGINSLLIEGGGKLAASFLQQQAIDKIYWYHAPLVLGSSGLPAVAVVNASLERYFNVVDRLGWPNGDSVTVLSKL